jgi:nicotinic acid phosphoribosyltransferase
MENTLRPPDNPFICAMLTDMYQLSMGYAYWSAGRHEQVAHFDLFFRKAPFGGQYTVFAGLSDVLKLVATFNFTQDQVRANLGYFQCPVAHAPLALSSALLFSSRCILLL